MSTGFRISAALTVLVLALTASASAETLVLPAQVSRPIDNGAGESRILLRFRPIEGLLDMAIARAYLAIGSERRGDVAAPIVLQVHPILRDWSEGTATWTAGWTRPGGDIHDEIYVRHTVDPADLGRELRIDVESLIREMRQGTVFYGFALTVAPYLGEGLRPEALLGLTGLADARLVVEYEALPRVRLPARVR